MTKKKAGAAKTVLNPNSAKAAVFSADLSDPTVYPRFIEAVELEYFRHIEKLAVPFSSPVTVISGSNRSGKTTLLLSIACSHFDFKKRNYTNGKLERQTWSNVMKLTSHDVQKSDWTYHLTIKTGAKSERKRGQRKHDTRKWNGLGKKESQIKGVDVVYLDLDRILPARHYSPVLHQKAKNATGIAVSHGKQEFIEACLSYVLEEQFSVKKLADHLGKDLLGFSSSSSYSSYNSASGEDVLSRILIDCIDAPENSLILIDELELGLHPKVQRRLMDMIFEVSERDHKQFIITTHSGTVISSVPDKSRVFIDLRDGKHVAVSPISINAALSKMDSSAHPLIDVFCEDEWSRKIVEKSLQAIEARAVPGVSSRLFNIIESGPASDTHTNFLVRDRIYKQVRIKSGHVCILDGDMRSKKNSDKKPFYPPKDGLFFLPSDVAPEKLLCDIYESANKNTQLRYHIDNSNVHCLFDKMIDHCGFASTQEAFDACWHAVMASATWAPEFDKLTDFLIQECRRYSPDL